jgi:hypothetical protein
MRRVCSKAAVATAAASQVRSTYSIWGSIVHEGNSLQAHKDKTLLEKLTHQSDLKGFQLQHTPDVEHAGLALTPAERYLHSALADDTKRLLNVDWTHDFDSFWADLVASHAAMFEVLYGEGHTLQKWVMGNCSKNAAAKLEASKKLSYLQSALAAAQDTERCHSAIVKARFTMQREIFDAFEREKLMAGVAVLCNEHKARVPAEFRRKATVDLDWHKANMRHWVWDAPIAKAQFPRELA